MCPGAPLPLTFRSLTACLQHRARETREIHRRRDERSEYRAQTGSGKHVCVTVCRRAGSEPAAPASTAAHRLSGTWTGRGDSESRAGPWSSGRSLQAARWTRVSPPSVCAMHGVPRAARLSGGGGDREESTPPKVGPHRARGTGIARPCARHAAWGGARVGAGRGSAAGGGAATWARCGVVGRPYSQRFRIYGVRAALAFATGDV